ncbi:hypothetical protein [Pseudonocardia nigra]|uniref:hypothetical protein n=1 Tax=Pseudonocardia nigra TaxID=1921578 RepID=UPI001C5E98B2|nr:hypothetical protein [Pseudonocardia nigra]
MHAADVDAELARAQQAAMQFVLTEAGFAQVTSIDASGFPVARTMTAFLTDDWSVELVQRRSHRRLGQWRRDPHTSVTWVGSPAPGASNERPHVFDVGLLPPRLVSIRGHAEVMPPASTVRCYSEQLGRQREHGWTRAPVRTREQVLEDLVGIRIRPVRVRLEGFGTGAQSFTWDIDDAGRNR